MKFLFDLLYHDGPFTSVYNLDDKFKVYDWIESIGKIANRWMVFDTTRYNLEKFIRKEISFHDLADLGDKHHVVVIDTNMAVISDIQVDIQTFPKSFLMNGMYDPSLTPDREKIAEWL